MQLVKKFVFCCCCCCCFGWGGGVGVGQVVGKGRGRGRRGCGIKTFTCLSSEIERLYTNDFSSEEALQAP